MLHRMHILDLAPSLSIQSPFLQISRASSLKHLNIGGTFITDESLYAIAKSCPQLKVSLAAFDRFLATIVHKMTLLWRCLPYPCMVMFLQFSTYRLELWVVFCLMLLRWSAFGAAATSLGAASLSSWVDAPNLSRSTSGERGFLQIALPICLASARALR